jgi:hypothetical protein
MQVDALAVRLRPRPMPEAADLGVLLVRRHARSIARTWGPLYIVFALLALATIELGGWVPGTLIFCAKPWLDRSLMFVLSRATFGEETRWGDLWAQRSSVWWRDLLSTLTIARLSPWRSYTQAIGQLEGQRGRARRNRRDQLLRGKRGAAGGMHFIFANAEMVLCLGLMALALWFAPEGTRGQVWDWISQDAIGTQVAGSVLYALVVLVLEPFYVAAGFAMYLNRRVELEAWDVEQEFRRAFA